MAKAPQPPHFVLIPFLTPGHMNPMVDLGRLLAAQGALVTLITTPANAADIQPIIDRAKNSFLPIRFAPLPFPSTDVGLPAGCESLDSLPGPKSGHLFHAAVLQWSAQIESHLKAQDQRPNCVIADSYHGTWVRQLADNLGTRRLSFYSMCCLTLLSYHNIYHEKVYERISDEHEPFVVPDLAHSIKLTKTLAPELFPGEFGNEVRKSDMSADGIVVNTFHELESWYVESYEKAMKTKIWALGPMSLCNNEGADMAARGRKAAVDAEHCMSWLDGMEPNSVVYVSFGSLTYVKLEQVVEIGCGLVAAGFPFLWVVGRVESGCSDLEKWLREFEVRAAGKGMVVRGWAPQMVILGHVAVGGFVTHCGWNSVVEAMAAGVPMVTWPFLWDQFLNERVVVDVVGVGVCGGVKVPAVWDGSRAVHRVVIGRGEVERAVREMMQRDERRDRASVIKEKAEQAMRVGGSSYENIKKLIEFVAEAADTDIDGEDIN